MGAVVQVAHLQQTARSSKKGSNRDKKEYEEVQQRRLAVEALRQKRRWLQSPDKNSFGKASPLCQEVLKAAVKNARVGSLLVFQIHCFSIC